MATRTVTESVANVTKKPKSALFTVAELTNDLVALGNELRTDHATTKVTVDQLETLAEELGTDHATFKTVVDDLKTLANNLRTYVADGMKSIATIVISGADAAQFKTTTTCVYKINGVYYTKAATDSLTFSAANTINTGAAATAFWGAWLVEIGVDGNIHTKPSGVLADQVYANEAAAIAALPAETASHVAIGYITVSNTSGAAFTANTTHLHTAGGDTAAVNFYDLPTPPSLPAAVSSSSPATLAATTTITSGPATLSAAAVDDIAFRALGAP